MLSRLRDSFQTLRDPTEPLAHGAMILFSGALLLTPGFFTDAVGFLLLVPAVRSWLLREVAKRVEIKTMQMGGGPTRASDPRNDVIDAQYTVEEPSDRNSPPSQWTKH